MSIATHGRVDLDGVGGNTYIAYDKGTGTLTIVVNGTTVFERATTAIEQLGGTLTGSVDGTMADVAAIALSTSDTYSDSAVNTAVNTAITAMNLQLKELQTKVNELVAAAGGS